jgi:DNA-binding SARP family transcriptional activator
MSVDIDASSPSGSSNGLRIWLLGKPDVRDSVGEHVETPRKALLLFAYLVLECRNRRLTRREAADFLWEDLDQNRRVANLRQLLLRLRSIARTHGGACPLNISSDEMALSADVDFVDVDAFRVALADAGKHGILQVCETYGGVLLHGIEVEGQQLSEWLRDRRSGLRRDFSETATKYLQPSDGDGLPAHSHAVAQRLLECDPTDECAYRTLMRIYAENGDSDAIDTTYKTLKRLLRREVEAVPSAETDALYRRLRQNGRQPKPIPSVIQSSPLPFASVKRTRFPKVALRVSVPIGTVAAERELLSDLADTLCLRLWQHRLFDISEPFIRTTTVLWGTSTAAQSFSDYVIEVARPIQSKGHQVSVRLLSSDTREILWGSSFDANRHDTTLQIAFAVIGTIERREAAELAASPEGTSAYRLSIQGQQLLRALDLRSIRRARNGFRSALALDPSSVIAATGVAHSLIREKIIAASDDDRLIEEALDVSKRAVGLDPENYMTHRALGIANLYRGRFDACLEHLYYAQRLSPAIPILSYDIADALAFDGRPDAAAEELEKARLVLGLHSDPGCWVLAGAKYLSGDYRAAAAALSNMTDAEAASRFRAGVHAMLGERTIAKTYVKQALEFNPDFSAKRWLRILPFRRQEDLAHCEEGLLAAGFV